MPTLRLSILLFCLAPHLGCGSVPSTTPTSGESVPGIVRLQPYEAHRASSHNPTGANRDHRVLPPQSVTTLADLRGPGIITHLWFTIDPGEGQADYLSDLILRMRWDDDPSPSVEVPFGPFFALGHNECADVRSAAVVVMATETPAGRGAFNFYLPMPFRKRAEITVENKGSHVVQAFFYHVDYRTYDALPEDIAYFHASYRSERTVAGQLPDGKNRTHENDYRILDVTGRGHYVGCTLHVEAHEAEKGKWYEGDDCIQVDGAAPDASILGTGAEDYFNLAWGMRRQFQAPYYGMSYRAWNPGEREMWCYGRFSLYRWHLPDPIPFERSLSVRIEHGHDNDAENLFSSVAYYYLLPSTRSASTGMTASSAEF